MEKKEPFRTLYWEDDRLYLLDQTLLPEKEEYPSYRLSSEVAQAIRNMIVRGAPAIGITAAYGIALAAREIKTSDPKTFLKQMEPHLQELAQTRPTAVNLFWAIERMRNLLETLAKNPEFSATWIQDRLLEEAKKIHEEDVQANRKMGALALALLPKGKEKIKFLTHCNAGALATGGYGTALGVIYAAHAAGKELMVYADETRPFLQGSRLTAWELMKNQVPVTVICDNMAGHIMKTEKIDLVVVGADRIAANGDVANKIGTYSLAILAREHGIPFYVAAPTSTLDLSLSSGDQIPIEERNAAELTELGSKRLAPRDVLVKNPAFDVTPAAFISAIITEKGIAQKPFLDTLKAFGKEK